MSSFKDTFEPNAFEANTFACGAWRGIDYSWSGQPSSATATGDGLSAAIADDGGFSATMESSDGLSVVVAARQ